jgi:hypothetical protein
MQMDAEFEKEQISTTFFRVVPVVGPLGGSEGSTPEVTRGVLQKKFYPPASTIKLLYQQTKKTQSERSKEGEKKTLVLKGQNK